jgi:hypothetical protein
MDKIQILMEKYGLSAKMAYRVEGDLEHCSLYEFKIAYPDIKSDNKKNVDLICKAEPINRKTLVGSQDEIIRFKIDKEGNQYRSIRVGGPAVIELFPQIKSISFKLINQRISIDDPAIIEYLRQCLCKESLTYTQKREAKRPKKYHYRIMKVLAMELMDGSFDNERDDWKGWSNELTKKQKYVNVCEIFKLYLPSWEYFDFEKQRETLLNILK